MISTSVQYLAYTQTMLHVAEIGINEPHVLYTVAGGMTKRVALLVRQRLTWGGVSNYDVLCKIRSDWCSESIGVQERPQIRIE